MLVLACMLGSAAVAIDAADSGSEVCEECDGTGRIVCPECLGRCIAGDDWFGYFGCIICGGSGTLGEEDFVGGIGTVACKACGGTGSADRQPLSPSCGDAGYDGCEERSDVPTEEVPAVVPTDAPVVEDTPVEDARDSVRGAGASRSDDVPSVRSDSPAGADGDEEVFEGTALASGDASPEPSSADTAPIDCGNDVPEASDDAGADGNIPLSLIFVMVPLIIAALLIARNAGAI